MGRARFDPIAIVGQGCVLPGCFTPGSLWRAVAAQRSLLTRVPAGRWGLTPEETARQPFRTGGFVTGFARRFDPSRFDLGDVDVARLDPVCQWLLQAGQDAWHGVARDGLAPERIGVIAGNLSYPSRSLSDFASDIWLHGRSATRPINRFNSGFPAMALAQALGARGPRFCLDAACASSLYALKLACDELQTGRADCMVAGAVNATDNLILHQGFNVLNALSPSGRSRPLVDGADGLVPAEGAAAVVLKRLSDVRPGERVHGVIRGIGLSNDGRRRGFLAPDGDGQMEAMRRAYAMANLDPGRDIDLLECHATGTPIGDGVELRSAARLFGDGREHVLPVGSLKSNTGHLITVAGLASLIKLTQAMAAGQLPPTLLDGPPHPAFKGTPLAAQADLAPWTTPLGRPRRAGLSTFGFGGNNAHLIVEERGYGQGEHVPPVRKPAPAPPDVAICGVAALAGPDRGMTAIVRRLMRGRPAPAGPADTVSYDPKALRTPPADLNRCESQQLAVLDLAEQALDGLDLPAAERLGCYVGMACAPDATRWMLRERLAARLGLDPDSAATAEGRDAVAPPGTPADVLGAMPNMPANRVNNALDWRGQGFTLAAEHQSGAAALRVAMTALQRGEIDLALVAAADFSADPVHQAALDGMGLNVTGGDGAAALVLKRRADAMRDGDRVLALAHLPAVDASRPAAAELPRRLAEVYGHSHAAGGLLALAVETALESRGLCLTGAGVAPIVAPAEPSDLARHPAPDTLRPTPHLAWYAAGDRADLANRLRRPEQGGRGPVRLALVADSGERLDALKLAARACLEAGEAPVGEGMAYGEGAPEGDLALVFTGSASTYPQAGRGLFAAFPELGGLLTARSADSAILAPLLARPSLTPFQDLCCGVLVSQAHATFWRDWMGLAPDAALGLSLGETNALIAFGAWRDSAHLLEDIARGEMYERHLGGRFEVAARAWGERPPVRWQSWHLSLPVEQVRAAVADVARVELTIIYSPEDCLIGGAPDACEVVLDRLGRDRALRVNHDFTVHAEAMRPYADTWRRYHTRKTHPVPGVRFYTNALNDHYTPDDMATADCLTRQAVTTIDFPRTVEKAYRDGVRTFLEVGPRGLLTDAIGKILGDRPHRAMATDRLACADIEQVARAAASLFAAGHLADLSRLQDRLTAIRSNPWPQPQDRPTHRRRWAHRPPPRLPDTVCVPPTPPARGPSEMSKPTPPTRAHGEAPRRQTGRMPKGRGAPGAVCPLPDAPRLPPLVWPERLSPGAVAALQETGEATRAIPAVARGAAHTEGQARAAADARRAQGDSRSPTPEPTPTLAPTLPPTQAPTQVPTQVPTREQRVPPRPWHFPRGPTYDRADLEAAARAPISTLFGELFAPLDGYRRQVRLPAPPLLLVDRITGIEATAGEATAGRIWTETDLAEDAWYLHQGHMRPGPLIEAGQADLSLIAYMGADFDNRDARVYRLLGCEITFQNGPLPRAGETLSYQIAITGHANLGETRLFFFEYDAYIGDRLLLSVRNGQAGFFTDAELRDSRGVRWDPAASNPPTPDADPTRHGPVTQRRGLTPADLDLLRKGDVHACFGAGFERGAAQSRPPKLPGGDLAFIDAVTRLDLQGGPWGRGYLKAVQRVSRDAWFYEGHFHNDPCMPGTLMVEAAIQALEVYAMAAGLTLDADGHVFEPVLDETATFYCRGQVVPDRDHTLTYEVFVDTIETGDTPTLFAALLASSGDLKVFYCPRIGLRLRPDWPGGPRAVPPRAIGPADASGHRARGDAASLQACANGAPSEAFGAMYARFDRSGRVPRLPQPPYHCVSEILDVSVPPGQAREGATARARFDISPDAWYFGDSGNDAMPYSVLSEVLLQPCGWLASHCGFATGGGAYFRNLDGDIIVHSEVTAATPGLHVDTVLTGYSRMGTMTLVNFDVVARDGRGAEIATLTTSFGFFSREAFARQAGVKVTPAMQALSEAPACPEPLLDGRARKPGGRLSMLDQVDVFEAEGGPDGLGALRATQTVDPAAWYFQAHFFQDPVQPGSLGLDALLQAMGQLAERKGLMDGLDEPRLQSLATGRRMRWRCRGQVTPERRRVAACVIAREVIKDPDGVTLVADGTLWCDGLAIYEASGLALRMEEAARR